MAITTRAKVLQYLGLTDDATSEPAVVVTFLDDGATTQVNVSKSGNTLTVTPTPGSAVQYDLTLAANDTLTELVAALDALAYVNAEVAAPDGATASTLIDTDLGSSLTTAGQSHVFTYSNSAAGSIGAVIDALILQVQAEAEDFCGRSFDQAAQDERLSAYGHHSVSVSSPPIDTGSTVTVSTFSGASETTLSSTEYTVHADEGRISLNDDRELWGYDRASFGGDGPRTRRVTSPGFPTDEKAVRVQYTGGWATIPASLEGAATRVVAALFEDRGNNPMLSSDQLEGRVAQRMSVTARRDLIAAEFGPWRRAMVL